MLTEDSASYAVGVNAAAVALAATDEVRLGERFGEEVSCTVVVPVRSVPVTPVGSVELSGSGSSPPSLCSSSTGVARSKVGTRETSSMGTPAISASPATTAAAMIARRFTTLREAPAT